MSKLNYTPDLKKKTEDKKEIKKEKAKTGTSKQLMLNTALSAYEGSQGPSQPAVLPNQNSGYGRTS